MKFIQGGLPNFQYQFHKLGLITVRRSCAEFSKGLPPGEVVRERKHLQDYTNSHSNENIYPMTEKLIVLQSDIRKVLHYVILLNHFKTFACWNLFCVYQVGHVRVMMIFVVLFIFCDC
jgi:hypothetical protein